MSKGGGASFGSLAGLPGKYVMTLEGGGFWPGFARGGYVWLPVAPMPVSYWEYAYYVYVDVSSYSLYSTLDGSTFALAPRKLPLPPGSLRP